MSNEQKQKYENIFIKFKTNLDITTKQQLEIEKYLKNSLADKTKFLNLIVKLNGTSFYHEISRLIHSLSLNSMPS